MDTCSTCNVEMTEGHSHDEETATPAEETTTSEAVETPAEGETPAEEVAPETPAEGGEEAAA